MEKSRSRSGRAGTKKKHRKINERRRNRRVKRQQEGAVADSIKVFFSTSGYLLSQLENSEACADAMMLADRATDAQVRVVYNIMASDRMKLSSLRPLPEPYVFGAVVLRALGEIGPIFPDEALVEWLRLFVRIQDLRQHQNRNPYEVNKPFKSPHYYVCFQ